MISFTQSMQIYQSHHDEPRLLSFILQSWILNDHLFMTNGLRLNSWWFWNSWITVKKVLSHRFWFSWVHIRINVFWIFRCRQSNSLDQSTNLTEAKSCYSICISLISIELICCKFRDVCLISSFNRERQKNWMIQISFQGKIEIVTQFLQNLIIIQFIFIIND